MRIRTSFPYETRHEDIRIPLPDGTRLYARVWRPLTGEPVPALLEYLPCRLTDRTAPRDRQRHPWYAGHGYASVRVDVRGYGNSDGVPGDPCSAAVFEDGAAVVEWLAGQPWCSGRVGMFGIGWGGLASLRIAALAPEPLKAVVAVCPTDDGFGRGLDERSDDGFDHGLDRQARFLPATGVRAWSPGMPAFAALPPDPLYAGDEWRTMWLDRLQAVELFPHTRFAYARTDHGAIRAAVLAVGGWHDPYRDTVLRLVERLDPSRVRGLIGPWAHHYPDRELPPGPAIGFLQETLRWWEHWLEAGSGSRPDTGRQDVTAEPLLRSWIGESHPPATAYGEAAGRWVGDDTWPSRHITPVAYVFQGPPLVVDSPQHTGLDAGSFLPRGGDADLPADQRDEDAKSGSFEFAVPERTMVLGRPRVTLRLRLDAPCAHVVARLCDVAPDGASTLVTRGAFGVPARGNGTGGGQAAGDRAEGDQAGHLAAGGRAGTAPHEGAEDIAFELNAIGHTFPAGHRIRLSVSSAYWPWVWPPPRTAGFTLEPEGCSLELPVRAPTAGTITFEGPEQSEPLGVITPVTLDEPRPERLIIRDVAKGERRLEAAPGESGTRVYPDGLEITEEAWETYTIQERDPLSAHSRSDWRIRFHRPDMAWDIRIEARSESAHDTGGFLTSDEVVCRHGDEVVFHRTWEKRIPHEAG
ncbi:CocE/NonD family hydrolase [Streptomyces sp. NPDC057445]|uniref:CocE/NonD family hydrolase n=1 Tax=Streptomyces sp. NPDC057445 TaxID=3346136 RepID=UPI003684C010